MDSCWYYYLFGEEFGPVTRQQLVELADDGTLSGTDRVRHASGEVMQEVQSVLGIDSSGRTPVRSTPAAASPLTMMTDSSGTVVTQVQDEMGPSIDDFVIEKTSDDSRISPAPAKLSKPAPPTVEPTPSEPASAETFYLRSSETTIGPLTLDALCRMADAGKVASADYIRRASESGWHPASEVPEVMASVILQDANSPKKRKRSGEAPGRRRSHKGSSGSGVRPRNGRNGKQKPRTRDEQLQGIFDEVFPQENASSVESTAAAGLSPAADPSATRPTPATPDSASSGKTPQAASGMGTPGLNSVGIAPPVVAQGMSALPMAAEVAGPPSMGATDMPATAVSGGRSSGAAGGGTGTSPPVKPWTPPKKKKQSGGGMDPDTVRKLGIGAAVVAVLALLPMIWSLLSDSRSAPDSGTVKPALVAMVGRYDAAAASPDSWKAFQEEVRPQAGGWVKQYRAASHRTPEQLKLQEAATQLVQLVNSKHDDRQKHEKFLEKINEQLSGAAG